MTGDNRPLTLKGTMIRSICSKPIENSEVVLMSKRTLTIDPDHVARAMANSLAHASETAHQITGLHFEKYARLYRFSLRAGLI